MNGQSSMTLLPAAVIRNRLLKDAKKYQEQESAYQECTSRNKSSE
jgi:hypothetical protein